MSAALQELERKLQAEQAEVRRLAGLLEVGRLDAIYIKDVMRDGLAQIRQCLGIISGQIDASARLLYELEQRVYPNTLPPSPSAATEPAPPEDKTP